MSDKGTSELVEDACIRGVLDKLADEYIIFCYTLEKDEKENECDKKKSKEKGRRFPNIAGFCRYCGIGQEQYERLSKKYVSEFEKLRSIFEDEALNSEISPSILSAYLKRRLGYGDSSNEKTEVDTGQLKLIFEHDILLDGE